MKDTPGNGSLVRTARLILVPRSRVDLYRAMKRSFADDARTDVVLDRRFRDRRVASAPHEAERRQRTRRRRSDIDAELDAGSTVTIPVVTRTPDLADRDAWAILRLCCAQHVVPCHKCHNTFRIGWLPRTESGLMACPLCGFDIMSAIAAHTETCSYWIERPRGVEPATRVDSHAVPVTDGRSDGFPPGRR